jgi:hypothetical protein
MDILNAMGTFMAEMRGGMTEIRRDVQELKEAQGNDREGTPGMEFDRMQDRSNQPNNDYITQQKNLSDDDEEMEDAPPRIPSTKRRLSSRGDSLRPGGEESLDSYSRLATHFQDLGTVVGAGLKFALNGGEMDYSPPTLEEIHKDLFRTKKLVVDKILVRAEPAKMQKLMKVSQSSQIKSLKLKKLSGGFVPRSILNLCQDVLSYFRSQMAAVADDPSSLLDLMTELTDWMEALTRMSLVMVDIGITNPDVADSVSFTIATRVFGKFNETKSPCSMISDLHHSSFDADVQLYLNQEIETRNIKVLAEKEKGAMCYRWEESGQCVFGSTCRFSHSSGGNEGRGGGFRRGVGRGSGRVFGRGSGRGFGRFPNRTGNLTQLIKKANQSKEDDGYISYKRR